MEELRDRTRGILYAVITEFIATGEPVGSRTLARQYGLDLSTATIRSVLAELEEQGYLAKPHTSAGRAPTDKAFRFFIDTLMQVRPVSRREINRIDQRLRAMGPGTNLVRESGRMLSEMTGTAAVVIEPRPETRTLRALRFMPTRPGEMLAVIVLADGSVENRFIIVERSIAEGELNRIHNVLAEVIEGRTLGEVRELFARRLYDERIEVDSLRHRAFELGQKAVAGVAEGPGGVVIEGEARLFGQREFSDVDRLRQLLSDLDEREILIALLDRTIAAHEVRVFVGREVGEIGGGALSVVAAPYTGEGNVAGTIGVLGPTRMDYARMVPLVEATAEAMSEALKRRTEG
jgi:heat-inducible transcriptional repressor